MAYAVFSTAIATKITIVSVPHFTLISPISIVILCFLKKSCQVATAMDKTGYTGGQVKRYSSPFSRCFSLKTAFLKWIFEADPVGVQIRAVSHFNGLEETFKMRQSTSSNSHWIGLHRPSKLNVRKNLRFSTETEVFFEHSTLTAGGGRSSGSSETCSISF